MFIFKDVQYVCKQGCGPANEDTLVVNHEAAIYAVIDGVTALPGENPIGGITPGSYASNHLARHLSSRSLDLTLAEIVLRANAMLREAMVGVGFDPSDKARLWSAAFASIRIHPLNVEFVQAGDCMLFARYDDGTIRAMTRDQLLKFDQWSIRERQKGRCKDDIEADVMVNVSERIVNQRTVTNTIHGYGILNGEPELVSFLESGTFNRAGLVKIYLVSDGMFYPSQLAGHSDWDTMIHLIDELGMEGYADHLLALEKDDENCTRFPRHKVSDDKTGLLIEFPSAD